MAVWLFLSSTFCFGFWSEEIFVSCVILTIILLKPVVKPVLILEYKHSASAKKLFYISWSSTYNDFDDKVFLYFTSTFYLTSTFYSLLYTYLHPTHDTKRLYFTSTFTLIEVLSYLTSTFILHKFLWYLT